MSDHHIPGTRPFFHGDGRSGENPQAFMRGLTRDFMRRATITDSEKFEWLRSEMYPGSDADEFLDTLTPAVRKVWTDVVSAIEKRWPPEKRTVKTREEREAALLAIVLKEEDCGVRTMVDGVEEMGHVRWVNRVVAAAAAAGDTDGWLISQVRNEMPKAMRNLVEPGAKTWADFGAATKAVSAVRIREMQVDVEREHRVDAALLMTPTSGATRALGAVSISSPRTPSATGNPFVSTQPMSAGNLFANYTPPQIPRTPSRTYTAGVGGTRNRPIAERWADLQQPVVSYATTVAGRAQYTAAITAYSAQRAIDRLPVDERNPYPLTPGTVPAASNECWSCGQLGHTTCPDGTAKVPSLERTWRYMASGIYRGARAAGILGGAAPIRFVNTAGDDIDQDTYNAWVIQRYLDSQGNGGGSSA